MTILNGGGSSGVSPNKFNQGIEDVKDAVQDVQTSVNSLSSTMQSGMSDLQDSVEEMQTAVQNAPVGGPMPYVLDTGNFSAESVENGIKLTYKATIHEKSAWGVTVPCGSVPPYGIMIRYGTDGFPRTPNEGILAVDDTDIVDKTTKGPSNDDGLYGKTKTFTVVGLTSNTLYYFSAFPYSYDKVFNTNYGLAGTNQASNNTQRKTCQWTGTKGTLTVTITQDYDYKTLGEITVTATPTAGGDPVSASRTGAGNVSLSLDGGEYTVSFSAYDYYTAPESQTINVTAGQPNTLSVEYKASRNLNDYSWSDLEEIGNAGGHKVLFKVLDEKTIMANNKITVMRLDAFDQDDLSDGSGKANYSFVCKNCTTKLMAFKDTTSGSNNFKGYADSDVKKWLENTVYNNFEEDLKVAIKSVSKMCSRYASHYDDVEYYQMDLKMWVPSIREVNLSNGNDTTQNYPAFTDNNSRKKKIGDTEEYGEWWLRDVLGDTFNDHNNIVNKSGTRERTYYNWDAYVVFGFCI